MTKLFTFKSADYFDDNEELRTICITTINNKLNTRFPDKWHSLYKFAVAANLQEGIKSLSNNFLAKYNLYRSLSFIFLLSFVYYAIFFQITYSLLPINIAILRGSILFFSALLWFTFHVKFKRYWTLCGNESLMSLYYFLNKDKLKRPE